MSVRKALPPATVQSLYNDWVRQVAQDLDDPRKDRNETVITVAEDLLPWAYKARGIPGKVMSAQLDPRNITLEAEYYGEMDPERFYRVKPLLWLWRLFDMSPQGQNVHLGLLFRAMLAKRIFKHCGEEVRIFEGVTVSFGYNISCADRVSIHRNVLIDDRGEVLIGREASLSDYVNIYSHDHSALDIRDVSIKPTVIGEGARLTYHSTVLAGRVLEPDSMVGCLGVVTRDINESHIAVGVPAKAVRVKERPG